MDVLISGTIVQALPVRSGTSKSGNNWSRASYIIEHEHGQYPRRMVFDVKDARIQELNLQVGETVTLHLNVSCREFPENSGKFFNSIEAWKADRMGQQPQQYAPQGYQAPAPQYQPQTGQAPFPPQPTTAAPQPAPFPQQQINPASAAQQPQGQQLPFPPAQ